MSFRTVAVALLTASLSIPPNVFANDPGFVGSYGGGDSFRDRPAANLGAYSERAAQPLPTGRYNNNSVVTSGNTRNDGGNVDHPLFTGPVNRSQTMTSGESSLGNLGGSNALALTARGRETVSGFVMAKADAESHDGTYNRPNGADNLKGLANIVAAKLVRGEAVTPKEMSILNRAAEVDNMMTGAQGKPPTALSRVAAIAESAQSSGGKLTTGQKVELRTILDHSAFYVRENDSHQITSVGATLVAPRVSSPGTGPVANAVPEGGNAGGTPAPKMMTTELRSEPGAITGGNGGDAAPKPGAGGAGGAPEVGHPVPGAGGGAPPMGAGAGAGVPPAGAGAGVPPVAANGGAKPVPGAGAPVLPNVPPPPGFGPGAGASHPVAAAVPAAPTTSGSVNHLTSHISATVQPPVATNVPVPGTSHTVVPVTPIINQANVGTGASVPLPSGVEDRLLTAGVSPSTVQGLKVQAAVYPQVNSMLAHPDGMRFALDVLRPQPGMTAWNPVDFARVATTTRPQDLKTLYPSSFR